MQPRLKTSQKWTALPPELLGQMKTVLGENFRDQVEGGGFEADGRIYPGEILMVTSTQRPGSLKQSGFEVSLAYRQSKDNVLKMLHLGMDAIGALFEQLFSGSDEAEFPVTWSPVQFEGHEIFVRYTTVNSRLEAEADRLLGQREAEDDRIAGGDWDAEIDPAVIKAQLGISDDED